MQIIIKCDCGNEITIPAPAGKYTQLRDYLETKQFHFGKAEIKNGELKEFKINIKDNSNDLQETISIYDVYPYILNKINTLTSCQGCKEKKE